MRGHARVSVVGAGGRIEDRDGVGKSHEDRCSGAGLLGSVDVGEDAPPSRVLPDGALHPLQTPEIEIAHESSHISRSRICSRQAPPRPPEPKLPISLPLTTLASILNATIPSAYPAHIDDNEGVERELR